MSFTCAFHTSLTLAALAAVPFAQSTKTSPAGAGSSASGPLSCADSLRDQASAGCIQASSAALLGMLYPLSSKLYVDEATGNVGMGTTFPTEMLQIGEFFTNSQDAYIELRTTGGGVNYHQGLKMRSSNPFFGFDIEHDDDALKGLNIVRHDIDVGAFDVSALFIDRQSGNVGIATETPDTTLQVAGRIHGDRLGVGHPGYSNVVSTAEGTQPFIVVGNNNTTATGFASGVYGNMTSTPAAGAFGAGVWGRSAAPAYDAVFAEGDFAASGVKAFVSPHPRDASKEVRFVCLEGNESGTYFRGTARLVGGRAVVEVPEDFRMVTEAQGLTVQLTARGSGRVWFESLDLDELRIGGESETEVCYLVNGVRRGYSDFQTVQTNRAYRPLERGVPYGAQYPQAIRDMLVENGVLNSDYTPNETTAARLGWELSEPHAVQGTQGGIR